MMKRVILAILIAFTVTAVCQAEPQSLPMLRQGQWSFETGSTVFRAAELSMFQAPDPWCDFAEAACNRNCAGDRNELGCFMSCMDVAGCPVGLVKIRIPKGEILASAYSQQSSVIGRTNN